MIGQAVGVEVTLFDVPANMEARNAPLPLGRCRSLRIPVDSDIAVIEVLENAGFDRYQSFTPATAAIEADVAATDLDLAQFHYLFGVDDAGRMHFNSYDDRVSWHDFVRAVDQGLYDGNPSRIAVYHQGVAGGTSVEFLEELLKLLMAGVPGAVGGAIATKLLHPVRVVKDLRQARRRQIAEQLRRRGFTGPRLLRVMTRYPAWDPERLQKLFDFTEAEATRVLSNAGYEPGEDGLWRASSDAAQKWDALEGIERRAWKEARF